MWNKRRYILPILLLIALGIFGLYRQYSTTRLSRMEFLMDTTFDLTLYGKVDATELQRALDDSYALLRSIDANSTSYREGVGNPFTINHSGDGWKDANADVLKQLEISIPYWTKTQGEFNIAMGGAIDLWKTAEEIQNLPDDQEIAQVLSLHPPEDILLDDENGRLYLPTGLAIDLGAVTKGYAIGQVYDLLSERNLIGALINAGGNIMALGHPQGRDSFTIALQDPQDASNIIGTIPLKDHQAISTSGSYNRYYTIGNTRYSHILSGLTGHPPNYHKSVTVLTNEGIDSDILSTVLFLLPLDAGLQFLDTLGLQAEALFITQDDQIITTEGFPITYAQNNPYKTN